ncbi:hypothetical protein DL95DRAFT_467655 [Leptodontidium sp. 2 PMI_412]|nr:hypothetical protein DL95DRAFT_467655 [Leptodontidium sp. 2 PMI_412]
MADARATGFQIREVATRQERLALRASVRQLKATNRAKFDLNAILKGNSINMWPVHQWKVEGNYVPNVFAVTLAKNEIRPHDPMDYAESAFQGQTSRGIGLAHTKRLGRFAAWFDMETDMEEFGRLLPARLQTPVDTSDFREFVNTSKVAIQELKTEILHQLTIPIVLHFVDTDEFVANDLDLSTQQLRISFYTTMVRKWPMLVAWMFDELVGNLLDMKFIWSQEVLDRGDLTTLRSNCQNHLFKRFMLYIDTAMIQCVAHDTADPRQHFFDGKGIFYNILMAQNKDANLMKDCPKRDDWPFRVSLTINHEGPWTSKSLSMAAAAALFPAQGGAVPGIQPNLNPALLQQFQQFQQFMVMMQGGQLPPGLPIQPQLPQVPQLPQPGFPQLPQFGPQFGFGGQNGGQGGGQDGDQNESQGGRGSRGPGRPRGSKNRRTG